MADFIELVSKAFRPMLDSGLLSEIEAVQDDAVFGNASVVLGGNAFRLRFIRDRNDMWVDVASEIAPNQWFPIERVLAVLGVFHHPEGLLSPSQAEPIVKRYWAELERGLSTEKFDWTRAKLAQVAGIRHQEIIKRISGAD